MLLERQRLKLRDSGFSKLGDSAQYTLLEEKGSIQETVTKANYETAAQYTLLERR